MTSESVSIENCYYKEGGPGITCDSPKFDTVVELSEAEMKKEKSYKGFDFDNIWIFNKKSDIGTPELRQIIEGYDMETGDDY